MVLRKVDYAEADRVYTLLGRTQGKLGAIAKGVRRASSRLGSALELYSLVEVQLAPGRSLDVVTEARRLPGLPALPADPLVAAHAAVVAELAERMCEDRHPLEGLFDATAGALVELAGEPDPRRTAAWFMAAALHLMGYAPQLMRCARCGAVLPAAPAQFIPAAGGLVCQDDAVPGPPPLSVTAIKVLRLLFDGDRALYRRLRLDAAVVEEVEGALAAHLEYHLDRPLKSLRYLRRLR